jgi:hypothetical protein
LLFELRTLKKTDGNRYAIGAQETDGNRYEIGAQENPTAIDMQLVSRKTDGNG